MADFYLRRYQVTPEQQRAYDRYVRSRMQLGAGAAGDQADLPIRPMTGSPTPDASAIGTTGLDVQPSSAPPAAPAVPLAGADGSSVVAPRASIPDSLPAALPVGAMQPNGFAVHPNPNAPTNMPVSPARMRPSQDAGTSGAEPSAGSRCFGQQALDGISTDINWLETRASKLLGGIAGIPRALLDNADALAQYLGVPPRQLVSGPMVGPLADLVAHKNYVPTSDEAANFSRRGFGILPYLPPDVNMPGPLGPLIDKSSEGALGASLTGGLNVPALFRGASIGAGSEAANQIARAYDQKHGTNTEKPVRLFGDIMGLTP